MIEQTEEFRQEFEHLTTAIGFTHEEALRVMRDDDLWLMLPEQRLELPDDEAIVEWGKAIEELRSGLLPLAERFCCRGTNKALLEGMERAEAALERAQQRSRLSKSR